MELHKTTVLSCANSEEWSPNLSPSSVHKLNIKSIQMWSSLKFVAPTVQTWSGKTNRLAGSWLSRLLKRAQARAICVQIAYHSKLGVSSLSGDSKNAHRSPATKIYQGTSFTSIEMFHTYNTKYILLSHQILLATVQVQKDVTSFLAFWIRSEYIWICRQRGLRLRWNQEPGTPTGFDWRMRWTSTHINPYQSTKFIP